MKSVPKGAVSLMGVEKTYCSRGQDPQTEKWFDIAACSSTEIS